MRGSASKYLLSSSGASLTLRYSSVVRPSFVRLSKKGLTASPCSRPSSEARSSSTRPTNPLQPRIIYSAIQSTGVQHLGNYLGAIKPWVDLQTAAPDDTRIFAIADLHSLTSRSQTPAERRQARRDTLATLVACGLDPEQSIIYFQSSVPQHTELHWILSCQASMGWLSRMTTWKTKLKEGEPVDAFVSSENPRSEERLKLGLFSYPVLQAADILLYKATHVPVGEDQFSHIDFARNIAFAFNNAYGNSGVENNDRRAQKDKDILVRPWALMNEAKRVMSLTEPEKKMSKSHKSEKSRILLTDSAETIMQKFRSALTDSVKGLSYDQEKRSGVANLVDIVSYLGAGGREPQKIIQEVEEQCKKDQEASPLRKLKEMVSSQVASELAPIRAHFAELQSEKNKTYLDEVAEEGRRAATERAEETMRAVRHAVGL